MPSFTAGRATVTRNGALFEQGEEAGQHEPRSRRRQVEPPPEDQGEVIDELGGVRLDEATVARNEEPGGTS